MVRVGGGWDTLQHYLDKHDPCRCKAGKMIFLMFYQNLVQTHDNKSTHNYPLYAFLIRYNFLLLSSLTVRIGNQSLVGWIQEWPQTRLWALVVGC